MDDIDKLDPLIQRLIALAQIQQRDAQQQRMLIATATEIDDRMKP